MSHFIKLTVNDSLYQTLLSLSEQYSMPVATLCNFLVANGAKDIFFSSCCSTAGFLDFIKNHEVDGMLRSSDILCYLGNHTAAPKLNKKLKFYKIKRKGEIYGKKHSCPKN